MTVDALRGADVLRLIVRIAEVTVLADGFQRVEHERRFRGGEVTLLAARFHQTRDLHMGSVRHDQVALHAPRKAAGGVLAVAQQALLAGLWGMAALGEDVAVAGETLADLDLGEILSPSAVFSVASGASLLHHVMIPVQKDGPMTGIALIDHDPRPGLMATAAEALKRGMRADHFAIHEDGLMAGEKHPSRRGTDER